MKMIVSVLLLVFAWIPRLASAHEVYVLDSNDIREAMTTVSPNPYAALESQSGEFAIYAVLVLILLLAALRITFWKRLQRTVTPFLEKLKKYAPIIVRITLGASLIAGAYAHALFGPELPLDTIAGEYAGFLQALLYSIGVLLVSGLFTRIAAFALACVCFFTFFSAGAYTVSYVHYLASATFLLILEGRISEKEAGPEDWAFLVLRVFYGAAIIFASIYAKFIYSNLALKTIDNYHLTDYLHFSPLFLVLGACLVEIGVGLCIMIGFELRLTLCIFTLFLVVSGVFFGEAIWPHLILFGLNIALFFRGYDRFTLLRRFSRDDLEPVL